MSPPTNQEQNSMQFLSDLLSTTKPVHGQADRALRRGLALEKNGQAKMARHSFHQAATLYQCCAEVGGTLFPSATDMQVDKQQQQQPEMEHLEKEDKETPISIVIAYLCLRLAFLHMDALGEPDVATHLYALAAQRDPASPLAYEGWAQALRVSQGLQQNSNHNNNKEHDLSETIQLYRHAALELAKTDCGTKRKFHLAVLLQQQQAREEGTNDESAHLMELCKNEHDLAPLIDSWHYICQQPEMGPTRNLVLYRGTYCMLRLALEAARPLIHTKNGMLLEFGVGSGRSMRMTREIVPCDVTVHGFDTFTGIPVAWGDEVAGSYSTGGRIPNVGDNVHFHKGLFSETLPPFLEANSGVVAFANIDCDLYSSTVDILENLQDRIVPGTILIFDEYIGYDTWRQDEFKAWKECCDRLGWKYKYCAFSLSTNQAVVQVTYTP